MKLRGHDHGREKHDNVFVSAIGSHWLTEFQQRPSKIALGNAMEVISGSLQPRGDGSLTQVLRELGPFDELSTISPPTPHSPPKDWTVLVERVQAAAIRIRDVEAEANAQELHVQHLLENVREDMRAAEAQVKAADARLQEANTRAATLLRAAEERVQEAEERARIAEEWLSRVEAVIRSEFFLGASAAPTAEDTARAS